MTRFLERQIEARADSVSATLADLRTVYIHRKLRRPGRGEKFARGESSFRYFFGKLNDRKLLRRPNNRRGELFVKTDIGQNLVFLEDAMRVVVVVDKSRFGIGLPAGRTKEQRRQISHAGRFTFLYWFRILRFPYRKQFRYLIRMSTSLRRDACILYIYVKETRHV